MKYPHPRYRAPSRHLLQRGESHASLLKSGNPPTQLAPQRSGSPCQGQG
ncbi:hypothetical protein [Nostoc sp. MS1]|nr:hypothetical protein [Nostoc sp. MS1]